MSEYVVDIYKWEDDLDAFNHVAEEGISKDFGNYLWKLKEVECRPYKYSLYIDKGDIDKCLYCSDYLKDIKKFINKAYEHFKNYE